MSFLSGPFNLQQGNSAQFVVEFFDSTGLLSIPPSATMQVIYTNISNVTQTDTVILTSVGSFFTGVWSSSSAGLGLATWTATTSLSTVQISQGQLRIINRKID